eukprot:gnl/Ergobibamus_cyprinoides/642.p1 GENE.gnl/Ergobibamus_cyprinoides/642~~gnl/Ergobibamus_cyprinoides/642.p1  ORF type:complete len:355 (+),score=104.44 gnl/Ergobibamus_cyprinoides/642:66-1130(+)
MPSSLPLIACSTAFLLCYTSQSLLVKYQDDVLGISLPFLCAIFLTAAWPVNLVALVVTRVRTGYYTSKAFPGWHAHFSRVFRRYTLIGLLDGLHIALLSLGLNALPGSLYMILKSSSLAFNIILGRLVLGKRFTVPNVLAVVLTTVGIIISSFDPHKLPAPAASLYGATAAATDATGFAAAFVCSILSAFLDALQTVLAQVLFEDAKVPKSQKTLDEVFETANYNGLVSFLFVLPVALLSHERATWSNAIGAQASIYLFVGLLVGCSKQGGIGFKFGTVKLGGSLLAGIVDMLRRVVVIFACIALFGESFTIFKLFSVLLTVGGFAVYTWGRTLSPKTSPLELPLLIDGDDRAV